MAAAVILKPRTRFSGLNDSKAITARQRDILRIEIEQKAVSWAVGIVSPEKIDEINILNASFLAMHRAIEQLNITPELLLIDGNRFSPYLGIAHECIVKGDAKYRSIAAASVLAKTHRDEMMESLHGDFPQYDWIKNKGYPTAAHRHAVFKFGSTPHHRTSFQVREPQPKTKP